MNKFVNTLIWLCLCGVTGFVGWKKYFDYQSTNTGLIYKFVTKSKDQISAQEGQFVYMERTVMKGNTCVAKPNEHPYYPLMISYEDLKKCNYDGGLYEAIGFLHKGDVCLFKMKAKYLMPEGEIEHRKHNMNIDIDPEDEVVMKLYIRDIINKDDISGVIKTYMDERQKEKSEEMKAQLVKDVEGLNKYLKSKNIIAKSCESGLHYSITKEGEGDTPKDGDIVTLDYIGKHLLSGKVFDTSIKEVAEESGIFNKDRQYEPIKFTVGENNFIPGFTEGILLLNKGTEAVLYIPSQLAYGSTGVRDIIEPNENIVFNVKIFDIEHKNTEQVEPEHQD